MHILLLKKNARLSTSCPILTNLGPCRLETICRDTFWPDIRYIHEIKFIQITNIIFNGIFLRIFISIYTRWIHLFHHFHRIRIGQVHIGSRNSQDDDIRMSDILEHQFHCLLIDISGLVPDRNSCDTGKVDQGQVQYCCLFFVCLVILHMYYILNINILFIVSFLASKIDMF